MRKESDMTHVAVIGAGITGVTTAYSLLDRGFKVTVFDKHRYAAMETSYANGGQLSASNAEVWNNVPTLLKGLRWMTRRDAPLLLSLSPSWHKYSWLAEFVRSTANYRDNTIATVKLAMKSRGRLFQIAEREKIDFDLERRGILHIYHDEKSFRAAEKVNRLLVEGGLDRDAVSAADIATIEPALVKSYYGGFYTPLDASGDIHKFTRGLADTCSRRGAKMLFDAEIVGIKPKQDGFDVSFVKHGEMDDRQSSAQELVSVDKVVICAGVESRAIAAQLGERINIYPVKGYSITVYLDDVDSRLAAPSVSLLDEEAKIVTSRLGADRFRVAGTAEFSGFNLDIRSARILPLVDWVSSNFTRINTSRVVPWAGLRPMMPDMMPVVRAGRRKGAFFNTGHGHLGWTLSAATAELVSDLVSQDI
jgi:D-amino-acid dehydrogenase